MTKKEILKSMVSTTMSIDYGIDVLKDRMRTFEIKEKQARQALMAITVSEDNSYNRNRLKDWIEAISEAGRIVNEIMTAAQNLGQNLAIDQSLLEEMME